MYRIYAIEPDTGRHHGFVSEAEWEDTMDVFGGAPFTFALLAKPAQTTPQIKGWHTALKVFEHATPEVDHMLAFLKNAVDAGLSLNAIPYWAA
jgi:hypothetical protein